MVSRGSLSQREHPSGFDCFRRIRQRRSLRPTQAAAIANTNRLATNAAWQSRKKWPERSRHTRGQSRSFVVVEVVVVLVVVLVIVVVVNVVFIVVVVVVVVVVVIVIVVVVVVIVVNVVVELLGNPIRHHHHHHWGPFAGLMEPTTWKR